MAGKTKKVKILLSFINLISECFKIPDSVIGIRLLGILVTKSIEVFRDTSNVFKFRLFIPKSCDLHFRARSSLCASTKYCHLPKIHALWIQILLMQLENNVG